METDVSGYRSTPVVLKTIRRMPRAFINQLYAVDIALTVWVSLGTISYAACAYYLEVRDGDRSCKASIGEQVASIEWTFQVQTAAFGAVLLLNLLNLGMRQHLLPFKCNLLLLYINAVAFATDLLLWRGSTAMLVSSSGRPFAPLRYVQWAHSTPSMIYMLALLADCRGLQLVIPLLNDVMMVATGLAACFTRGLLKDLMTVLSFATFTIVLYFVYGMFHKTLSGDVSPEQRSTLRTVLALLLAVWSAFPVVWLAADWSLMGPQAEAICWGVCDYLAKVVFSSQLWQSNLTEVQLRKDRALEAWEATNRVEAVARLTALLKQRDDLLSTLSHELRTPLAGIVALSETLYQEISAALPTSAQNLATVRATATCMLNIVTSTLDSFAARRGGLEPPGVACAAEEGPAAPSVPLAPVDLRPLVETVTTVLRPLAHDGVSIVSELPSNLPHVLADVTRLNQVLYNLVGNAMRFTSHGEVKVAVRVILPEGSAAPEPCSSSAPGPSPPPPPVAPPPPAAPSPASAVGRRGGGGGDCSAADPASSSSNPSNSSNSNSCGGAGGIWRYARPRLSQSSASSSCSSTVVGFPPGSQVEVSVEDTGVGIAQELLDELFMPYRTGQAVGHGDGTRGAANSSGIRPMGGAKNIGGTGLGLYLVRLALRAQGSDVTAESAPGIGSVFRFRLPIAQPQQHHHSAAGTAQSRRVASLDLIQQQQQQQHAADDDVASGQHPLLVDCMEARSSCTSASDASAAADRGVAVAVVPNSPKPTTQPTTQAMPSSPKPWIASATSRLMRLSSTAAAAAACGRGIGIGGLNFSSGGGGGAAALPGAATAAVAAAAVSAAGPPMASAPARPSTGVLALQEDSVGGALHGRTLRMSLDDRRSPLRLPQPPQPPKAPAAARCSPSCSGACCGPESAKRAAWGCAPCEKGEVAEAAAARALPALATAAEPCAAGAALRSTATPAAQTPTPTPTAAASRLSGGPMSPLTPFDVAHAVEEGRALSRAGLRPNFRHRNQGVLQVLSVDDDPINQLVAGQMLASQSWKVVKCMNGPEALAHLQLVPWPGTAAAAAAAGSGAGDAATQASLAAAAAAAAPLLLPAVLPDCVLLDVMMPGMSGFEVCRKLREHFSSAQLPIIIVSAKGDSAAVEEAFESGADDYMTKPYKRTEMVARIKAQIRIRDSVISTVEAAGPAAAAAAATAPAPFQAGSTAGSAPVSHVSTLPPAELSVSSLPVAALAAPGPLPGGGTASATPTAASTPRAACASSVAARALLGSGAVSDVAPPPVGLSPLHPLAPLMADVRPTSVDVLLLQKQTTPDSIKTRMEAARCGLDGSWGKTGLYKRENILSRTAGADGTAGAATAVPPLPRKDSVTAPAAMLGSTTGDLTQESEGACACTAVAAFAAAATGAGPTGLSGSREVSGVSHRLCMGGPATVDAAVGSSRPLPTLPEGTEVVPAASAVVQPVNVVTDACALLTAGPSPASPPPPPRECKPGAASTAAGAGDDSEPAEATALMREVLSEVRRGRAKEAEVEKLNSRVATLRTACCTLAAERDGWRRLAHDLRALMASGFGGAAAAAMAAGASPSPGGWASTLSSRLAASGTGPGTPTMHLALTDALATAHASRSSGDSLVAGVAGGAGAAVAAQLEDLKKEAALLRQQLSIAMASVGNGSLALGPTDMNGSRTLGLASGAPALRQQRSGLSTVMPPAADSRQSGSGLPVGGAPRGAIGDAEHSGGGGGRGGDAAQQWGVPVFPNYADGAGPPDLFITTETSNLSAASGFAGGAACDGNCSADGRGKAGGGGSAVAAVSRSPPSLGGMSISEPRAGTGAGIGTSKIQKGTLAPAPSGSVLAASMTTVGPPVRSTRPATHDGPVAAAKHCNGDAAAPTAAAAAAAAGTAPSPPYPGVANVAAPAQPLQQDAPTPHVTPAAAGKVEPPQVYGELRGSSAASTGTGTGGRRSSVEDDMSMSQYSNAGRSPAGVGAAPGTASRGSRNRGGGGGSAATAGILRMLCSKGAAPAPAVQASPSRRNSNQQ